MKSKLIIKRYTKNCFETNVMFINTNLVSHIIFDRLLTDKVAGCTFNTENYGMLKSACTVLKNYTI